MSDDLTDEDICAWWRWSDAFDYAAIDMLHARGLASVEAPNGPTPEQVTRARARIAHELRRYRAAIERKRGE